MRAQLAHRAQHRHALAPGAARREHVERRAHRGGAGVVGIVDQRRPRAPSGSHAMRMEGSTSRARCPRAASAIGTPHSRATASASIALRRLCAPRAGGPHRDAVDLDLAQAVGAHAPARRAQVAGRRAPRCTMRRARVRAPPAPTSGCDAGTIATPAPSKSSDSPRASRPPGCRAPRGAPPTRDVTTAMSGARRCRAAAPSRRARSSPSRPPRTSASSGMASSVSGTPTRLLRLPARRVHLEARAERRAKELLRGGLAVGAADADHGPPHARRRKRASAPSAAQRVAHDEHRHAEARRCARACRHHHGARAARHGARRGSRARRSARPRAPRSSRRAQMLPRVGGDAARRAPIARGRAPVQFAATAPSATRASVQNPTARSAITPSARPRSTSRRTVGRAVPRTWYVSCPLPASSTTSSSGARSRARARWRRRRSSMSLVIVAAHAALDVVEDRVRIFGARIVARDDREVRAALGDRAHERPLAPVAVAAAAEDDDQLAPRERAHRRERALERIRRVRVVAQHRRAARGSPRGAPAPAAPCAGAPRSTRASARDATPRPRRASALRTLKSPMSGSRSACRCVPAHEAPLAAARLVVQRLGAHHRERREAEGDRDGGGRQLLPRRIVGDSPPPRRAGRDARSAAPSPRSTPPSSRDSRDGRA